MLKLQELTKWYSKRNTPAVDHISLHVKPGEIFGFIGPNGAGKTTTIKMITGILSPDEGTISICGKDIVKEPVAAKRLFGYVPDNPDIYDRLTGVEYLEFLGDIYGIPGGERKSRILQYATMFGIQDVLGNQIRSYSHGMRQKLVLIGALIHQPKLWIMDEPMVGLDPMAAHLLKEEMRMHCKKGNTVFFSTHVLEVAEKLCDRVGIIADGRLVAVGTLEELRQKAGSDSSLEEIFLHTVEQI